MLFPVLVLITLQLLHRLPDNTAKTDSFTAFLTLQKQWTEGWKQGAEQPWSKKKLKDVSKNCKHIFAELFPQYFTTSCYAVPVSCKIICIVRSCCFWKNERNSRTLFHQISKLSRPYLVFRIFPHPGKIEIYFRGPVDQPVKGVYGSSEELIAELQSDKEIHWLEPHWDLLEEHCSCRKPRNTDRGGFRYIQHICSNRGLHTPENVREECNIFCPVGPLKVFML